MRLTGNFEKKIQKNRNFFSIFSFLTAFVVSSCRKSGFRVFLSLRYGADLGRSRLVYSFAVDYYIFCFVFQGQSYESVEDKRHPGNHCGQ